MSEDVMTILDRLLDKVSKLEEKIDSLSIKEFSGTINASNVTVSKGEVKVEGDVDTVSVTSVERMNFDTDASVSVNSTERINFDKDVNEVTINDPKKIDINEVNDFQADNCKIDINEVNDITKVE